MGEKLCGRILVGQCIPGEAEKRAQHDEQTDRQKCQWGEFAHQVIPPRRSRHCAKNTAGVQQGALLATGRGIRRVKKNTGQYLAGLCADRFRASGTRWKTDQSLRDSGVNK